MTKYTFIVLLFLTCSFSLGQGNFGGNFPTYPQGQTGRSVIQQQNRRNMQHHGIKPPPTQAEIQRNLQQQSKEISRQKQLALQRQSKDEVAKIIAELNEDAKAKPTRVCKLPKK